MSESMHISVCVSDCHPRAGGDPRINRAGIRHADMSSPRRRGSPWALPPPPPTPIASSPRRRGSMHQPGRNTPRRHVIPAQAGIHGRCHHRRQHRLRHPRTGGGPRINRAGIRHTDMSSPRRRGSMGVAATAANTDCVILAQAGSHASTGQEYATQTCHPRAGGDPWVLPPPPPTPIASSPHRWGSTHQPGRNTPRRHVIPAQAGIHGRCRHRRQHRLRHPRTGGDPRQFPQWLLSWYWIPACAGMTVKCVDDHEVLPWP